MSTEVRRELALSVAVSLVLHAVAVLALGGRNTDPIAIGPPREAVLDVIWWTGVEGTTATRSTHDGPDPSGSPRSFEDASPDPSAGRAAPGDERVATASPNPAPVSERGETAAERPKQAPEPPPSVSQRRHRAVETGGVGSRRAPRRPGGSATRRETEGASAEAPRGHASSVPGKSREAATLAGRGPPAGFVAGGRPGVSGPRGDVGSPSELAAYLARVRARIASRQLPYGGEQGRVDVRFVVSMDGTFRGLVPVSGDRGALADAALRVVRRASPAPPIPSSLGRTDISVTVTIKFE